MLDLRATLKNTDKVRDHCHFTGKYRGAAHKLCNLPFKKPKFTQVILHNLANYDWHLFIKRLGKSEGDIKCIPNNEEKDISFSGILQEQGGKACQDQARDQVH